MLSVEVLSMVSAWLQGWWFECTICACWKKSSIEGFCWSNSYTSMSSLRAFQPLWVWLIQDHKKHSQSASDCDTVIITFVFIYCNSILLLKNSVSGRISCNPGCNLALHNISGKDFWVVKIQMISCLRHNMYLRLYATV